MAYRLSADFLLSQSALSAIGQVKPALPATSLLRPGGNRFAQPEDLFAPPGDGAPPPIPCGYFGTSDDPGRRSGRRHFHIGQTHRAGTGPVTYSLTAYPPHPEPVGCAPGGRGLGRGAQWTGRAGAWSPGWGAGGVGDDQAGAAGPGDLAGGVPARPAHRVGPALGLQPERRAVLIRGAHLAEGHDHLGRAPGAAVFQRAAQVCGAGRGQHDLVRPGRGG